jgi:hypothetical protein
MTTMTSREINPTFTTPNTIIEALQHLSPKYLAEALQFIQFLEYKSIITHDGAFEEEDSLKIKTTVPAPRQVKVAGRLDAMTVSDRSFSLLTAEKQCLIKGIAKSVDQKTLSTLLGQDVLVSGRAHFTLSGEILSIEAEEIIIAKAHDLKVWGQLPAPLERPFNLSDFKVPQTPDSGMSAIYGTWPGDETDEEILKALEELS